MNEEEIPSHKKLKQAKNILTTCLILIITFISSTIYTLQNYTLGYKYVTPDNILLGVATDKNIVKTTIEQFLKEQENKGYVIVSYTINPLPIQKITVIQKGSESKEDLQKKIIQMLQVNVLATHVYSQEEHYYFKSDTEAEHFITENSKYTKQKFTKEGTIENLNRITSTDKIEQKITNVKQEYQKEQERIKEQNRLKEMQKRRVVTSRGQVSPRKKYNAPLSSYVYISSPYGMRHGRMHTGVDFAAPQGTHILAWKDGTVTGASWTGAYGNLITVKHNDNTVSRYAHCSGYAVTVGQKVNKGQTIGYVGSTGRSTGAHLHFEIKVNGAFVNPLNYL